MNEPQLYIHKQLSKLEVKMKKFRDLTLKSRLRRRRNLEESEDSLDFGKLRKTQISIKITRSGRKVPKCLLALNDTSLDHKNDSLLVFNPETSHKQFKIRNKSLNSKRFLSPGIIRRSEGVSIPFGMILKSPTRHNEYQMNITEPNNNTTVNHKH